MTSTPSRRALLKAAAGLTAAAGATLLGGRAAAATGGGPSPAPMPGLVPDAALATITDKVTWWDATSAAGPAVTRLLNSTILAWRGNQNSRNLTVANVLGTPGVFAGTTLQKTTLDDSSGHAPAFAPNLSLNFGKQLAFSGINGAQSLNVLELGVNTTTWTLTGQITGRTLVNGNTVGCTTGPAWGQAITGPSQVVVADQNGTVVVAQETAEMVFTAPVAVGFGANPRGPMRSFGTEDGGVMWVWTAQDNSINFAATNPAINGGAPAFARSAQASPYEPTDITRSSGADGHVYLSWTNTAGRIAIGTLDLSAVRRGTDPIIAVTTLVEQSLAAPALIPHPNTPSRTVFDLFWTGVDGTGALNAAVVTF